MQEFEEEKKNEEAFLHYQFTQLEDKPLKEIFYFLSFNDMRNFVCINKKTYNLVGKDKVLKSFLKLREEFKVEKKVKQPEKPAEPKKKGKASQEPEDASVMSSRTSEKITIYNYDKYSFEELIKNDCELIMKILKKQKITQDDSKYFFDEIIKRQYKRLNQDLEEIVLLGLNLKSNFTFLSPIFDSKPKTLKKLIINFNELVFSMKVSLAPIIKKTLIILNLSNNKLNDSSGRALFSYLNQQEIKLQKLNLSHNELYSKCFEFAESKRYFSENCDELIQLNVSNNLLGSKGAKAILTSLSKSPFPSLNLLNLSFNGIDINLFNEVIEFFNVQNLLTSLNLEGNYLQASEIEKLVNVLLSNTSLRYLYLGNNRLKEDSIDSLGYLLTHNAIIKHLDISYNISNSKGINKLFSQLTWRTLLNSLSLAGMKLGLESLKTVVTSLLKTSSIFSIDLSGNKFNDTQCGLLLAKMVSKVKWLKQVNISNCDLGATNAITILKALAQNGSISNINLSGNFLTNSEELYEKIQLLLKSNDALLYIYLDNNFMNEKEFEYVMNGVYQNRNLMMLSLKDNKIQLSNIETIVSIIESNDHIKDIFLSGNPIEDESSLKKIEEALRQNGKRRKIKEKEKA